MLDRFLDMADPYIAEAIFTFLATYAGWTFRYIFRTKQSQESLHKALDTGVDLVTDALAFHADRALTVGVDRVIPDGVLGKVINYATGSVPDAMKFLKVDEEQLLKMAEAKVKKKLIEFSTSFAK